MPLTDARLATIIQPMNLDTTYQQPTSPVPTVPWSIRDIVFAILLAIAGIVALNLLALGINFVLKIPIRQNPDLLLLFVVAQDLIVIGAAWLFGIVKYHAPTEQIGLRSYSVPVGCTLSAFLLFASYIVRLIYGIIINALGVRIQPQEILMQLDVRGMGFILAFIVVAVVAPVAEEIFFRGFVYGGLRRRIGVASAMLVSTVFFTALHLSVGLFIPIFVLGLFLAWLYEYTGSLYPGMFLHAANNGLALILLLLLQLTGQLPLQGS
jgi:membrane protease YdiL (CAAX protease family)